MPGNLTALKEVEQKHHDALVKVTQYLSELPKPLICHFKQNPYHILPTFAHSLLKALNYIEIDRQFIYPFPDTVDKDLFYLRFWHIANLLQALVALLPLIEPLYDAKSRSYPSDAACHTYEQSSPNTEGTIQKSVANAMNEILSIQADFLEAIGEGASYSL